MKRRLRVYKKTVSIVNETAIGMYESLVGNKKGFLLESYDKNYDRYTFFGKEPEEIITSRGNALVIQHQDGTEEVRQGNPLERLKEYYSEFDIVKENEELSFSGGLVGNLGYDFVRYAEVLPDNNLDEIGIETIQMMLMTKFILVDHVAETLTAVILGEDSEDGKKKALAEAAELIEEARKNAGQIPDRNFTHDGVIVNQSDTLEQYCEKVEKIKQYIREVLPRDESHGPRGKSPSHSRCGCRRYPCRRNPASRPQSSRGCLVSTSEGRSRVPWSRLRTSRQSPARRARARPSSRRSRLPCHRACPHARSILRRATGDTRRSRTGGQYP